MKQVLAILKLYFSSLTVLIWMELLGLTFIVAQAFVPTDKMAYNLSILGYMLALILPFLVAAFTFRQLISNRQLCLIPGMQIKAAIALLIMTILISIYIPVCSTLFGEVPVQKIVGLQIFISASIFIGLLQILITTRFGILLLCFSPVTLLVLADFLNIADAFDSVFDDTNFIITVFILILGGWCYGFRILSKRTFFKAPVFYPGGLQAYAVKMSLPKDKVKEKEHGLLRTQITAMLQQVETASGTLLKSVPDGKASQIWQSFIVSLMVPFFTMAGLFLFNHYPGAEPVSMKYSEAFILTSLYMMLVVQVIYGQMVPRGRLIWLRTGGNRKTLWNYIDSLLWRSLALNFLFIMFAAIAFALADSLIWLDAVHYILIVIGLSVFSSFGSTLFQTKGWSIVLLLGLLLSVEGALFVFAVLPAYLSGDYSLLIYFELALLCLGLLARYFTKQGFLNIDWCKIKPKMLPMAAQR